MASAPLLQLTIVPSRSIPTIASEAESLTAVSSSVTRPRSSRVRRRLVASQPASAPTASQAGSAISARSSWSATKKKWSVQPAPATASPLQIPPSAPARAAIRSPAATATPG